MQPTIPPLIAAVAGVFSAALFMSAFTHWMALLYTSLAKHGGSFLGPSLRRLIPAAPLVILLHPVPYLIVALLVVSVLTASGVVARSWWWFLGPFYAYVSIVGWFVSRVYVPQWGSGHGAEIRKRSWPFDVLERRRYQRQYRAAWALFLVQGTFAKLPTAQQVDITNGVTQLLLRWGVDAYAIPAHSPALTLIYAVHMKALGISPAIQGERWPLPERFVLPDVKPNSLRNLNQGPISRLLWKGRKLWNVYQRGGRAVDEARRDIIARGLDISPDALWTTTTITIPGINRR